MDRSDATVIVANTPNALRERAQWVTWSLTEVGDRVTKVPFESGTDRRASSTDATTWTSFDDAIAAFEDMGELDGVGFVFSTNDPFCGIDLDDCIDDEGNVAPEARSIIDRLDSYTEVSPSGRGVKIFVIASKPDFAGSRSKAVEGFKEIEIYDRGRYFTVTGQCLPGTPTTVNERQDQLEALCATLWDPAPAEAPPSPPRPVGDLDDEALLDRARSAKNGDVFERLWNGDTSDCGGDASSADFRLVCILAFWTGRDRNRMNTLFRRSGLYRPKWDERRNDTTYGWWTIDNAIRQTTEVYSPKRPRAARHDADDPPPRPDAPGTGSDDLVPLGSKDPDTGKVVLSTSRTRPTALAYIDEFHRHRDGRTLHYFADEFHVWRDNRYIAVEDNAIGSVLQSWLHEALIYKASRNGALSLVPFPANMGSIRTALDAVQKESFIPAATDVPSWFEETGEDLPTREILSCRNVNVHLPTGRTFASTPRLFTTNALDFDYDPDPEPPERWITFLEQLFGEDIESVETLQEWMGYCLVADTSQQKMLLMVGPKRSGKGTIGRILQQLVGRANVVGPTTSSLAGPFGLQPLIGKSLAIVSDARFAGEGVATTIERLLCISGEDSVSVDRKFKSSVNLRLPTRFMFLTNELPRLKDSSGALAGRFLILRLTNSFYGHEDTTLGETLHAELPGILQWAIDGWKRLHARGRFVQPDSAAESIEDLADLSSPVSAFVRDCCEIGDEKRAFVDDLYTTWREWCEREGRDHPGTKQSFGRDLRAALPAVDRKRGTGNVPFYKGIALREVMP